MGGLEAVVAWCCATFIRPTYPPHHTHAHCPRCSLSPPPETGIGGVGHKTVTYIRNLRHQWLNWKAGISCRWQQVSEKSRVTWLPVLRLEPITRQLLHFVHTLPVQVRNCMILRQLPFGVLRGMQEVGSSGVGPSDANETVTYCT
jgi:hypothetical protein